SPLKVEEQVVVIFAGTNGYLDTLPVSKVREFEQGLLLALRSQNPEILDTIRTSKELSKETTEKLTKALDAFAKSFA
ncbi:MAG: ATP synthase subunit alpha, partial [Azorhizobium sp. 12-66-6]